VAGTTPRSVVYSSGWLYGHPKCEVTGRYRPHLVTTSEHPSLCDGFEGQSPTTTTSAEYMTEASGPIVVTTDGTTTTIDCPESWGCGDSISP
jgi:hypothetical protein